MGGDPRRWTGACGGGNANTAHAGGKPWPGTIEGCMPDTASAPLQKILHEVFGYAAFRGQQAAIVDHVAGGGDAVADQLQGVAPVVGAGEAGRRAGREGARAVRRRRRRAPPRARCDTPPRWRSLAAAGARARRGPAPSPAWRRSSRGEAPPCAGPPRRGPTRDLASPSPPGPGRPPPGSRARTPPCRGCPPGRSGRPRCSSGAPRRSPSGRGGR